MIISDYLIERLRFQAFGLLKPETKLTLRHPKYAGIPLPGAVVYITIINCVPVLQAFTEWKRVVGLTSRKLVLSI